MPPTALFSIICRIGLSALSLVFDRSCLLLLLLLDELTNLSHLAEFLQEQPLPRLLHSLHQQHFCSPKWSPRTVASWECVSMCLSKESKNGPLISRSSRPSVALAVSSVSIATVVCSDRHHFHFALFTYHRGTTLTHRQSLSSSAVVSSIDSLLGLSSTFLAPIRCLSADIEEVAFLFLGFNSQVSQREREEGDNERRRNISHMTDSPLGATEWTPNKNNWKLPGCLPWKELLPYFSA